MLFPILCVFSLLFLLMKEVQFAGSVQVTVTGPGFQYSTMIPSSGTLTPYQVTQQVNYARSLAG